MLKMAAAKKASCGIDKDVIVEKLQVSHSGVESSASPIWMTAIPSRETYRTIIATAPGRSIQHS